MVKNHLAALIIIAAMTTVSPSYGQQKPHTLGSLWPKVESTYVGLKVQSTGIEAAQLNAQAVKTNRLPQLKAQAQNTYGTFEGTAGSFFPQAGFFNVSGNTLGTSGSAVAANSFASTIAEWEVFSFGKLKKEYEAAKTITHKRTNQQAEYILQLKKSLAERYITLLYNQAKLNWNSKNVERLNEIRQLTTGLAKAGIRPAADSLLALSSYNQSLGDMDNFAGLKNAALIKLAELYGDQNLDYSFSLSQFSRPIDFERYSNKTVDENHPILAALRNQADYFSANSEIQKRASLPSIRILGGYAVRGSGINPSGEISAQWKDGFSNTTRNYSFGIGAVWNITSLKTNSLKSHAYLKDAESTQHQLVQYALAMQSDLNAATVKISQQYKQIERTSIAMLQAEKAYGMYLARYKSGLIALSELLQIRQLLEAAENNHIEAAKHYWMLVAYESALTTDFDYLFNNL